MPSRSLEGMDSGTSQQGQPEFQEEEKKKTLFCFQTNHAEILFLFERSKGQQVPCEGFVRGAEVAQALCLPH